MEGKTRLLCTVSGTGNGRNWCSGEPTKETEQQSGRVTHPLPLTEDIQRLKMNKKIRKEGGHLRKKLSFCSSHTPLPCPNRCSCHSQTESATVALNGHRRSVILIFFLRVHKINSPSSGRYISRGEKRKLITNFIIKRYLAKEKLKAAKVGSER